MGTMSDECWREMEWNWDRTLGESSTTVFKNNDCDITFNPGFSVGTVAVRGASPLRKGYHHYWEVKMSTEVYGTDMMIGVGAENINLKRFSHSFVSFLGFDEHSWGLSYTGEVKHKGESTRYMDPFGQNAVIGVHLDLWQGTVEFYLNGQPQGVAFKGLHGVNLYPMISSTAARSGMNLIFAKSYPQSLQLQTILSLGRSLVLPGNTTLFSFLFLPPGLRTWLQNNYWWINGKSAANEKVECPKSIVTHTKRIKKEVETKVQEGVKTRSMTKKEEEIASSSKRMCLRSQTKNKKNGNKKN